MNRYNENMKTKMKNLLLMLPIMSASLFASDNAYVDKTEPVMIASSTCLDNSITGKYCQIEFTVKKRTGKEQEKSGKSSRKAPDNSTARSKENRVRKPWEKSLKQAARMRRKSTKKRPENLEVRILFRIFAHVLQNITLTARNAGQRKGKTK